LPTLSPKTATVAENGEKTATVAEFGDSHTFLRQSPFSATNCHRNRRQCRQALSLLFSISNRGHLLPLVAMSTVVYSLCRTVISFLLPPRKNISSCLSHHRHRGQSELVRTMDEPDWVYAQQTDVKCPPAIREMEVCCLVITGRQRQRCGTARPRKIHSDAVHIRPVKYGIRSQ